jgi:hypothetical protein
VDVSLVRPPVRPAPTILPSAATLPTIAAFPSAAHPLSVPWGGFGLCADQASPPTWGLGCRMVGVVVDTGY